jgi:hypothetical protein
MGVPPLIFRWGKGGGLQKCLKIRAESTTAVEKMSSKPENPPVKYPG